MSYLNKLLLPDERLVHIATLHWIIFIPGMIMTVVGGLVGFLSYRVVGLALGAVAVPLGGRVVAGAGFIVALLGLGLLIGAIIRQSATELAITNRRLIAKYGFISRSTFEIMINRVTGVNFDQTITGRILGYGTILVHGAGGDISPFDVVSNPQAFQHALMNVLEHDDKPPVI
ncbi:MAG: PH domain-containing protein [Alphaproteobacteria bacterium]|nr:PH domain-containing protein [Alphaproteobacteria bacterium]